MLKRENTTNQDFGGCISWVRQKGDWFDEILITKEKENKPLLQNVLLVSIIEI